MGDRADRYDGIRGNGCSYVYDQKTGKYGILYSDGRFYPDPDEKQPGSRPPQESSPDGLPVPTGPSDYDQQVTALNKYCPRCMEPLTNGICKNGCTPVISNDTCVLKPGTVLHNRYLIGRVLGQGGFGITYIGRDLTLETCVAVKEYFPQQMVIRDTSVSLEIRATSQKVIGLLSQGYEKFLKEARILARFRGETGIVAVLDFFEENNTVYIVMEYIDGQTLLAYLGNSGRLPAQQVFSLMAPVMDSLNRLHREGLIHRDISPDNIMLTTGGRVKLLDFGTVRSANFDGETLTVMLKRGYAPVEQYRRKGQQGAWTDVYALCATMYRCITGSIPEESLERLIEDTVQPPSQLGIAISPRQEAALMKGMACDPKERFQSVGELAAALYEAGMSAPPSGRFSAVPTEPAGKPSQQPAAYRPTEPAGKPPQQPAAYRPTEPAGKPPQQPAAYRPTEPAGRPSQQPAAYRPTEPAKKPVGQPAHKTNNVLMSDRIPFSYKGAFNEYWAFGSNYRRNQISTITFQDSWAGIPSGAWNVSEGRYGSVMAWVKPNGELFDLYIGAGGGVAAPADCCHLFAGYKHLSAIRFNGAFDTARVTYMGLMFHECGSLTALDLSGFNTAKVTNMSFMFCGCSSLTALDLSKFNTAKVTNLGWMFSRCGSLAALDLSSFNIAKVKDARYMFQVCKKLTTLRVRNWNTSNVDTEKMFDGCPLPEKVVSAILSGETVST